MELSSLSRMFKDCPKLAYVDMHGWNMPNLSSVTEMFSGSGTEAESLTINMSWSGLGTANELATGTGGEDKKTGMISDVPATLIVGEAYDPNGTDAYSQAMTRIINAFPADGTTWQPTENDTAFSAPRPVEYTVKYYFDGVEDKGLTETLTGAPGAEITWEPEEQPGYTLAQVVPESLTLTADEDNVIEVYYVTPTPKTVDYTVEYYIDGTIDDNLTEYLKAKDGEEIASYTDKCLEGWHLDKELSTEMPFTVKDGEENVIKVYYVENETAEATYTVYTWLDDMQTETTEYTGIVTDGTVTYVVPAAEDGDHFDHADPEAKELPEGGWTVTLPISEPPEENIINVHYAADIREGKTDDATPPESVPEPDPEGSANEEVQEGGEALSLARSSSRMAAGTAENGSRNYTEDQLLGENPDYSQPMVTAIVPTPKGSTLTYKVVVRYTGDDGVQSGRIDVRYPLPEGVKAAEDPQITIGGEGSRDESCKKLEDFKLDESKRTLTGAITGLHAGKEYEVSINCVLADLNEPADNSYHYWDGTAYAQTSNEAVSSNIMRLWWKEKTGTEEPEPPTSDEVVVKYQFLGQVPGDMKAPSTETLKVGESASLTQPTAVEGYTFDGWYRDGGDGNKVNSYEVTTDNVEDDARTGVTFYGTWKINPESKKFVKIQYVFPTDGPAGPTIPPVTVPEGEIYTVEELDSDIVQYYTFNGWKLADGTMAGETINTTGYGGQTITLTADWTPHTGTIIFNANGGNGSMGNQSITLANPGNLAENKFTRENYKFLGWSTAKDGSVEYPDKASTAGLITQNEGEIILYAVWEQEPAGYTVKYFYDEKEGTAPSDALTTGTGLVGTTTGVAAPEQVTIGEDENAKHYALDYIVQVELKAGDANVVKVYYAADEKGQTDPTKPGDGISDKYQATLIYQLDETTGDWVEGYLEAGKTEKIVVVTLKEKDLNGEWKTGVANEKIDRQIPNMTGSAEPPVPAAATAATDYQNAGEWTAVSPDDLPTDANQPGTVKLEVEKEYTFRWAFTAKPLFTVNYHLNGGSADGEKDGVVAKNFKASESGVKKVYADGPAATREGAVFAGWTTTAPTGDAVNRIYKTGEEYPALVDRAAFVSSEVTDYYAVWSTNEDADKGDTTPDIFQAKVTYTIVGGTWDGRTDAEKETFTVLMAPAESLRDIPTGVPDEAYEGDPGVWAGTDNEATLTLTGTPEGQQIEANHVYTFTLTYSKETDISYTIFAHYQDVEKDTNGEAKVYDVTLSAEGVSVKYGEKTFAELLPAGHNNGKQYPAETGKAYIFEKVTYTMGSKPVTDAETKLTATARIDIYYDVDHWSENPGDGRTPEGTPDGIADRYQVLVEFVNGAPDKGSLSGTTVKVYTLTNEDGTYVTSGKITISDSGVTKTGTGSYRFGQWMPALGEIDVEGGKAYIYTASWRAGTHTVTWVDYDHVTVLHGPITVNNGEENPPASDCPTPTRPDDGRRTWTFYRWLVSTDDSGNVTYTAQYRGVLLDDGDDNPGGGGGGTGGNGGNTGTGGNNGTVIYDPEVPLGAPA